MKDEKRIRKLITFDLNTKLLEIYYPRANWHKAYEDIYNYMTRNKFEHIQGSVYISKNKLSIQEMNLIVQNLVDKEKWLNKCMAKIEQGDLNTMLHRMDILLDRDIKIPTRKEILEQKEEKLQAIINDPSMKGTIELTEARIELQKVRRQIEAKEKVTTLKTHSIKR